LVQQGVEQYVQKVLGVLARGPEVIDLPFLVEAYGTIGWYAQEAEALFDSETLYLRVLEANAVLAIKTEDPKATANVVEAQVTIRTVDAANKVLVAKANARKLKSLQVEQAINALKFLGRNDSVRIG
jgi:hypothetical protein